MRAEVRHTEVDALEKWFSVASPIGTLPRKIDGNPMIIVGILEQHVIETTLTHPDLQTHAPP